MENKEIIERLSDIIKRVMPEVNVSNINEETRLIEDLKFDSLAFMMTAMEIEAEFNIQFDGPIVLKTVKDAVEFIQQRSK